MSLTAYSLSPICLHWSNLHSSLGLHHRTTPLCRACDSPPGSMLTHTHVVNTFDRLKLVLFVRPPITSKQGSHFERCNWDTLPVTTALFTFIKETLNYGHTTIWPYSYIKNVLCGHSVLASSSAAFAPRPVQFSRVSQSGTGHSVKKDLGQTPALRGFTSLSPCYFPV